MPTYLIAGESRFAHYSNGILQQNRHRASEIDVNKSGVPRQRTWAEPRSSALSSDINLLCYGESIVDLDAKISDGAGCDTMKYNADDHRRLRPNAIRRETSKSA